MTVDLWALLGAAFLGLVHLSAQIFAFKRQAGNVYTIGPRDTAIAPSGVAGRFDRANQNFRETFALFATVVLTAHVTDTANDITAIGAATYLGARILYLPAYALAIPWTRTVLWQIAMVGMLTVASQIVLG